MWIEIKKDIFESADFKSLNFILSLIIWHPKGSIPRHNLFVSHQELSGLESYTQLPEIIQKEIEVSFDKAINEDANKSLSVSNETHPIETYRIEEAIVFLQQPVFLVLENSLNDRYFLESVFRYFDKNMDNGKGKLNEFVKNNWIQFVNAGGWTNIENYIKGQQKSYEHLAATYGKEAYKYMRCFVMMDSDKQYPSQEISGKNTLKNRLESQNIRVHILRKRAMENYMPDEVIEKLPDTDNQLQTWVNAYKTLKSIQKNHLNYNDGFPKKKIEGGRKNKGRMEQEVEVQKLYPKEEVSDVNYTILDNGLKFARFKNKFPVSFQSSPFVHKQSLLSRESGTATNNEFLEILQKINDLL